MGVESWWYRANADWMFTDWVHELGYPRAGIVHWFLGHVRTHGSNRGRCKRWAPAVFAGTYGIPRQDVEDFLAAAIAAGFLIDDGKLWIIAKWAEYQNPDTIRKAQQRQEAALQPELSGTFEDCPGQMRNVPDNASLSRTRADTSGHPVTRQEQEQEQEHQQEESERSKGGAGGNPRPLPPSGFVPPELRVVVAYFQELKVVAPEAEAEAFVDHYSAAGWTLRGGDQMVDWKPKARDWQRKIGKFGPSKPPGGSESPKATNGKPEPNVDFWWKAEGNSTKPCKVINGKRTDEPFDEAEWRRNRAAA